MTQHSSIFIFKRISDSKKTFFYSNSDSLVNEFKQYFSDGDEVLFVDTAPSLNKQTLYWPSELRHELINYSKEKTLISTIKINDSRNVNAFIALKTHEEGFFIEVITQKSFHREPKEDISDISDISNTISSLEKEIMTIGDKVTLIYDKLFFDENSLLERAAVIEQKLEQKLDKASVNIPDMVLNLSPKNLIILGTIFIILNIIFSSLDINVFKNLLIKEQDRQGQEQTRQGQEQTRPGQEQTRQGQEQARQGQEQTRKNEEQ